MDELSLCDFFAERKPTQQVYGTSRVVVGVDAAGKQAERADPFYGGSQITGLDRPGRLATIVVYRLVGKCRHKQTSTCFQENSISYIIDQVYGFVQPADIGLREQYCGKRAGRGGKAFREPTDPGCLRRAMPEQRIASR
jgi:hypothetical protein